MKKIITGTAVAVMIGGTMAVTQTAAWGYRKNNGAAIRSMAFGTTIGAAASQPHYNSDYGYDYYE